MPQLLRRTRLAGPVILLLWAAIPAICQQHPSPALTIDASTLNDVRILPGPFLTQTGDNPHFADSTFDDSAWPQLNPSQPLAQAHLTGDAKTSVWIRIHLHLLNTHGPLGIAVSHFYNPYAVYANGQQIATSASMAARLHQLDPPFTIALPPANEITVAIRFYLPSKTSSSPLKKIELGPLASISRATELSRIHAFDTTAASAVILGVVLLAFAAFSLILYLAQRRQSEYLWLALMCSLMGVYFLHDLAANAGIIAIGTPTLFIANLLGYSACLASTEFVLRLVRAKPRWPVRLVELLFILAPFETLFASAAVLNDTVVPLIFAWFVILIVYLIQAVRSGNAENKLLLPPFAFFALVTIWSFASSIFRKLHFPQPFRIGRIGFDLTNLSVLLLLAGILAVVLYRFIRVTRHEQRAAAELEAARTVQQILIPETLPAIPGYTIASVYHPAQEVGGDFFQIIPLPSNTALIVLGDVSGKGMQAAMTVSLLVGALRAAAETTHSPAELLANLNRRLHGRGTGFTTCLILHLDAAGNLIAANAGHLQPYLDGHELALEPGLPLGFLPDATYPESHLTLAPNQTLTLLTDGIVEATSPTRELFGFDRTQAISTQSAHDIAAAATAFGAPAPQADDITVLTLHRLPA